MCVRSIKVPIRKKSGNLFYDPCIYLFILLFIYLFLKWAFLHDKFFGNCQYVLPKIFCLDCHVSIDKTILSFCPTILLTISLFCGDSGVRNYKLIQKYNHNIFSEFLPDWWGLIFLRPSSWNSCIIGTQISFQNQIKKLKIWYNLIIWWMVQHNFPRIIHLICFHEIGNWNLFQFLLYNIWHGFSVRSQWPCVLW